MPLPRPLAAGAVAVVLVIGTATVPASAARQATFDVVGDSVAASASEELADLGGTSYSLPQLSIAEARPALRQLGRNADVVVVALGAIDVAYRVPVATLRRMVRRVLDDDLADVRCVVWVDVNANPHPLLRNWPVRAGRLDKIIAEETDRAGRYVARWSHLAAQRLAEHKGWFESDNFHLRQRGQHGYANFVSEFVQDHC